MLTTCLLIAFTFQPIVVPNNPSEIEEIRSNAKFILVIEKDAAFQYLIELKATEMLPVILITGKGFPDSNTRELLRILIDKLQIPALGLCDGDPYGVEIMCVYRFGSLVCIEFSRTSFLSAFEMAELQQF